MVHDSYNWMMSLAGSGFKTEKDHLSIEIVTALFLIMPSHYLYEEICDSIQIYLRYTQKRANLKKIETATI